VVLFLAKFTFDLSVGHAIVLASEDEGRLDLGWPGAFV
jgi:hypothetical protein